MPHQVSRLSATGAGQGTPAVSKAAGKRADKGSKRVEQGPSIAQSVSEVDKVSYARLYGEPLFQLPQDLYIPPDALEIFLETFEGPLDLLLYLIRKQNFNVMDIPMAQVTAQYLLYVEQIRSHNLELAAEYLLMAAVLIEIKSRLLLPVKFNDTGEEAPDPRAELVRRLLEYEQMKLAAQNLDALPRIDRDFFRAQALADLRVEQRLPVVHPQELHRAIAEMMKRAKLNARHHITREQLSVRDHMTHILRRLSNVQYMEFTELIRERLDEGSLAAAVMVVHFIAILELARESLLEITQAEAYAPIYMRLTYTCVEAPANL